MKRNKNIIVIALLLMTMLFSACDKHLNIEPQQSIDDKKVYTNEAGIVNALSGAYSILAGPDFFAGTSVFHSDLIANSNNSTIGWIGTFNGYKQMNNKSLDPTEATIATKWTSAYEAINILNNCLANLDSIKDVDVKRSVYGQARFLRGVFYFELVRFYALPYGFDPSKLGVPIVTNPVLDLSKITYPSRSSISDVYTFVLNDLTAAKDSLEVGGANTNGGLASSTNASAFLVRVYMSMSDWANAAIEATNVIDVFGASALNVTPRLCYDNIAYTFEDVFMIRQNLVSNAGNSNNGVGTFYASLPGFGRGDAYVRAGHLALYEATDLRGGLMDNPYAKTAADINEMYYWGVGTNAGRRMTVKFAKFDAYVNVIRLAEMYLSRAEANFNNSSAIGDTPMNDINVIRARANATLLVGAPTLAEIKTEWVKEMCFEGHALGNLKRWKGSTIAPSTSPWAGQSIPWNDGRLVLPIPQREMDVNSNLVQNDAYIH
ncbi:MAG: RagB/SusD family nutrient uptake outer membrane protein [Bacteroidales bacterium]|nr:RagB/SusD family nutrient uptake outer membrane protein [Bacteroidales bacterium]